MNDTLSQNNPFSLQINFRHVGQMGPPVTIAICAIHFDSILSQILLPRIVALPMRELSIAACILHHQEKGLKWSQVHSRILQG
jgi:hypothetical protein